MITKIERFTVTMQLISKLTVLALFLTPLALAAPAENAPGQDDGSNDLLACRAGSYRCRYISDYHSQIEVCAGGGRWALSAKCAFMRLCQYDNRGLPYCP
ncbi:uncharacterized protein BDCG_06276 [Blastomyces dermatitidis ER-3]|nr:uncharacterized protein BDCG_06276 [Blastomyces dermatitidis ER-3]EEQ91156.1 hypothetical protein BDCG_06276 [Blastomyces dermatitidis ER-3]EQL30643.1 hypothetical protein BDFG_06904 [Blastomyces dermatitidis ATCC 26199]